MYSIRTLVDNVRSQGPTILASMEEPTELGLED